MSADPYTPDEVQQQLKGAIGMIARLAQERDQFLTNWEASQKMRGDLLVDYRQALNDKNRLIVQLERSTDLIVQLRARVEQLDETLHTLKANA